MANQHDPRRGTAKETAKAVRSLATLSTVALIATPFIIIGVLAYFFYRDLPDVRGAARKTVEQADKAKRTVGGYEHKPDETQNLTQRRVRAITAGVCIDIEGETPECREDAEDWLIDTYVRLNNRFSGTSPEDITTKSYVWVPDDWEYPPQWRDRPIETIEKGREACNARLKPKVELRVEKGANEGRSDKIQRPVYHVGGFFGGEFFAYRRVAKYPQDAAWLRKQGNRKCRIKFHYVP